MGSILRRSVALLFIFVASLWLVPATSPLAAQDRDFSEVEIETVLVAEGVWMLVGSGGNIGVSAGEDGVFLIDDQYAPLTDKIRAAVANFNPGTIRFVLNTHWHGDHVGGNENLGEAGALIVAHENVRERMSSEQLMEALDRRVPASPEAALPVVTFTDATTFHLNADAIHAFHVPPAHTDGDSIVHFREADVLHMGDVFFESGYPFVDLSSGGSARGVIEAVETALEIAGPETKIIPGHGRLTDREELDSYRTMLKTVFARVARMREQGKSLEEIQSANPTEEFDARWGGGFISADRFVSTIYQSLESEG